MNENLELELKHLAPYLPYGLRFKGNGYIKKLIGINSFRFNTYAPFRTQEGIYARDENLVMLGKPILRPLSDLTKEIEHNGKKFIPVNYIEDDNPNTAEIQNCAIMSDGSIELHYWRDYQLLFILHFDVFGLIEKGLAIDINTLKD